MRHIHLLTLALIVLGWCLTAPVHAYQPNSSGGIILRWNKNKFPLGWYINMNGYQGISAADAEAAFKHGMQQWNAPSCTSFRTVYKGKVTRGNTSDGYNVLMFGSFSAGSSTTAITYTRWGATSKQYTDADIVFRTTKPWSINPSSQQLDLRGTATHEIGHLLGLGHSSVLAATMYAKTGTGASPRRFLDGDDIRGLCFLYPATTAPPPECTKDADCSNGQICQQTKCVTKTDGRGVLCGSSAGGVSCNQGLLCVNKAGQPAYCVEYCNNGVCPNGGKCLKTTSGSSFCACDSDSDCNTGQVCKNRNCFSSQSSMCRADADCVSPLKCLEGTCQQPPGGCSSDNDCPSGNVCDTGKCVTPSKKGFGEVCNNNGDCTSNACAPIGEDDALYCTRSCKENASDCPPGYICKASSAQTLLCHVKTNQCSKDTDCSNGTRCINNTCQSTTNPEPPPTEPVTNPEPTTGSEPTIGQEPTTNPEPTTGSEPAAIPDAGTPETNQPDTTQSSDTAAPPSGGCGCQTQTPLPPALFLLAFLLALFRLRHQKRQA
jgi:Cys-rich repeat protein